MYAQSFKEVDGKFIVKRYLQDDLWETLEVDNIYNQSSFLLAKLIPTTYQKITTMGTATTWKLLMLAWSYEYQLAIPISEETRDFVGGLSRLFKVGYTQNVRKVDFRSLYPALQLVHDIFPSADIMHVLKSFLKYFHSERFKAKKLSKEFGKVGDNQTSIFYDRKQLPLKIFINSEFGSISSPPTFPWAELDSGEQVTCSGRQYLRLMVKFFMKYGYKPTLLDTDGVNFTAPPNENDFRYIGKGLNEEVEEGREYIGINAIIAEFNDKFMEGEMGLSLDGSWRATINISRKNYVLLEDDDEIKLTGATIKSKTIQTFIAKFLDEALLLLLHGKGYQFVQRYYQEIERIYNHEIGVADIATKAKVKKNIYTYKHRGKNINNQPLPKQAYMELAIKHNLHINIGDTIYYVNCGTKKSHGDVQEGKDGELYAKYISNDIIENAPNTKIDYNVDRYIDAFNSKVKLLLIVFDKSVRNDILITNPEDKKGWILDELKLVNGQPNKERDQDTLSDLFIPSDREIHFWTTKHNYDPRFWGKDEIIFKLPGLNKESVI
jgi:DNA polymerase elongation subunit (family B)